MGRGRAKGKKLTVSNQDDTGSGEEERIPAQKRRGRPQKPLKVEIDEDEFHKTEDDDSEDTTGVVNKDAKNKSALQNGKKRKKSAQGSDKVETVKEENGNGTKSSTDELKICNGIRPHRNRRKNTPRRAAEAVVECN